MEKVDFPCTKAYIEIRAENLQKDIFIKENSLHDIFETSLPD